MNNSQPKYVRPSKSISLVGWALGILFILKAVDFFLSIKLTSTSELDPAILSAILYLLSGIAMLLLAMGTITQARWVRSSLYVLSAANVAYIIYSTFMVIDWVGAITSFIAAILLFIYLRQTKNSIGNRLLGLQIFTILTLLPATVFILLTVAFSDQSLQDDSPLRLQTVEPLAAEDNLYMTLTSAGSELPTAAKEANTLVDEYPSQWDQITANQLLQRLQPNVNSYVLASDQEYQCPSSVNNFSLEAEMCSLNLLLDYAYIMKFAAITEANRGNITLAQEYALAAINSGLALVQSDNVTMVEYLVGLAAINIGLDTIEVLEQEDMLNRDAISTLLADISIPTETLRTPLQREYLGLRIALEEHVNLPQTYFYHPNRTRNELYIFMNTISSNSINDCNSNEACFAFNEELIRYVENIQAKGSNPNFYPNRVGNMYLAIALATFNDMRDNVHDINQRISTLAN